ncbi:hypothetical protein NWT09_22200 [Mycolicibacterium sp. jd]|uniref:hypothetical protein n=1 Tax=unclassified Mycolicibacterium TaxID=2636767 RepID=UPI00351B9EAE
MRSAALLVLICFLASAPMVSAHAEPPGIPDLRGYRTVPLDGYVVDGAAYFQTPDGLDCAILPTNGTAGCDGPLPATPAGANEIVLAAEVDTRGLRTTANPSFLAPPGHAAPVLPEGAKIVYGDFECAAGSGPITLCAKGTPAMQWMMISAERTGIGPATDGLPPGFPDPNDFVVGDDDYLVGTGPKNMFPIFTVEGGLTCSIVTFSGGEIGCNGPLPGVNGGENEIFAQLPGTTGIRRTDNPKFSTPDYPGQIRRLPVGHRVNGIGGICMAIAGGVACYGTLAGHAQGFEVSATETTTFG